MCCLTLAAGEVRAAGMSTIREGAYWHASISVTGSADSLNFLQMQECGIQSPSDIR
jgi:hypothetical protein